MSYKLAVWALVAGLLFGPTYAFAADDAYPFISPDWSSDRILEVWSERAYDVLQFSFRSETTVQGKVVNAKPAGVVTGTARLGQAFDHVNQGSDDVIVDYAHCRVYSWASGGPGFDNHSCYAFPMFRQMELQNRGYLNAALKEIPDSKDGTISLDSTFWFEQNFAAQPKPFNPLKRFESAAGIAWTLGDKTVVEASAAGTPIGEKDRQRLMRYLARYVAVHPQVRRDIIAGGYLPSKLTIERRYLGGSGREIITFGPITRADAPFPLPPEQLSHIVQQSQGSSLSAQGKRQALKAISGDAQPPRPSLKDNLGQLKAAAKAKNSLEATYLFLQLTQLHGGVLVTVPKQMKRLRKIMPKVQPLYSQGDAATLMQASDLAGSVGEGSEREAVAQFLASAVSHDDLGFGTFRYVTFANLARVTKDAQQWDKAIFDAMPSLTDCYWTHIGAFPWASNAYKDLGDTLLASYETFDAWDAWDLGKAADPGWKTAVMASVTALEKNVRAAMLDSF